LSCRQLTPGGLSGVLVVGVSVYLIGSIGVFFTRLIKAAVSRQRELLADASGVQFTRNPGGLAGALKKIGGLDQGSRILAPRAEEASHFYFSDGVSPSPRCRRIRPWPKRIALDPQFQGELSGRPARAAALEGSRGARPRCQHAGIPVRPRS
jgi:Zn-dependent protease with chaperone function